jgi:phosphoribosylanthranilate isomerase
MGGTGQVHDWNLTATVRKRIHPKPLILAGGLTPMNVRQAIRQVEPYGVDVSSVVERAIGVKDHKKIREFIANAKGAQN